MTDREAIMQNPDAYLTTGDLDKDFHRPECSCEDCERWRKLKDRPTHEELRALRRKTESNSQDYGG